MYSGCPGIIDIEANIFWKWATRFKKRIPDWSGTMHLLNQKKQHLGPASAEFLPMIDLKPSEESCNIVIFEQSYRTEQYRLHSCDF